MSPLSASDRPDSPTERGPRLVVFSSLFPSPAMPAAGAFIKERLFRVAKKHPLAVVAPQAWSPMDSVIRRFRPTFRLPAPEFERMDGIEVHRPRFLSFPGVFKRLDGWFMARGAMHTVADVAQRLGANLIDAHFLYPDGYAATRIGRRLDLPVTITLRGSKDEWLIGTDRERYLRQAMQDAVHLFSVSDALREDVAVRLGIDRAKVTVVGNGVDLDKFHPVDRSQARERLGLSADAKVLIGVGGLIERKGFHRVIPLLSELKTRHPGLVYLIVGGGVTQGDMTSQLAALAREHGVSDIVRFCGPQRPADLKWFYGAADVFALATSHEGWANVFLEAMACGLPVVTTQVGGNAQVVRDRSLGALAPYWEPKAFGALLYDALSRTWDRGAIIAYARENTWDARIARLNAALERIVAGQRVSDDENSGRARHGLETETGSGA